MEIHSSVTSSEELMHYGRKGMKWYQNIFSKDKVGSRKKGKSDKDDEDDESKSKGSSSSSSTKKSAKDMSEAELMSAIRHLQLEKQYRDLEAQQAAELDPPKTSKGKEFVSDFVKKSAVPAVQEAGKAIIKDWLVKVGKEAMGLNSEQTEDAYTKFKKEVDMLELQKKKTLVEDFYKNREEKAQKEAEKTDKKDGKTQSKKDKSDKNVDYYSDGDGKKKADAGAEYVKATVEKDTRTAKEKYDQSDGPVYTMDFTSSDTSSGQSFVSQFLLEDKSR